MIRTKRKKNELRRHTATMDVIKHRIVHRVKHQSIHFTEISILKITCIHRFLIGQFTKSNPPILKPDIPFYSINDPITVRLLCIECKYIRVIYHRLLFLVELIWNLICWEPFHRELLLNVSNEQVSGGIMSEDCPRDHQRINV